MPADNSRYTKIIDRHEDGSKITKSQKKYIAERRSLKRAMKRVGTRRERKYDDLVGRDKNGEYYVD